MTSEERYIENGRIQWDEVAGGVVGAFATLAALWIAELIGLIRLGITAMLGGAGSFLGSLIATPFTAGGAAIERAWSAAAAEIAIFGPFAFPVAVILVTATAYLLIAGVRRLVRW